MRGPGGRRNCKGETAKVGVAAFVVAASFAQTSTSAAAKGERRRANDGVGVAGTLLPSRSAATPTLSGGRPRQEVHPLGRGGMGVLDFMVSTISARTSMAVTTTGPDSIGVADWRLLPGFAATSMLSRDMEGPLEEAMNGDGDGGRDGMGSVGRGSGWLRTGGGILTARSLRAPITRTHPDAIDTRCSSNIGQRGMSLGTRCALAGSTTHALVDCATAP